MRSNKWITMISIAAFLFFGMGSATAQDLAPSSPQAALGTGFTYQGQLNDASGNPITDTCSFRFSLWDALTLGNQKGSYDDVDGVSLINGYFTVQVNEGDEFGTEAFTGEARWLGVAVHCGIEIDFTTLSPRQPLTPAPYASYAMNADTLDGEHASHYSDIYHNHFGEAWSGSGTGLELVSSSTDGRGVFGYATSPSGETYGVYGISLSTDGRGVYGENDAATGITYGVYGEAWSNAGYGVYGINYHATGITYGVHGESRSTAGSGVYGYANASAGTTDGVYGQSRSAAGRGVYGYASASTGTTYGVYGKSNSASGYGVYGVTSSSSSGKSGVYGSTSSGPTSGVIGETSSSTDQATGVHGHATRTSGVTYGVMGQTDSTTAGAVGVLGTASAATGMTYGVYGKTYSSTTGAMGVVGEASAASGTIYGVYGLTASGSGYGVYGYASSATGTTYAVYGYNSSTSGRGVYGYAAGTTGTTYGSYGRAVSPSGAGVGAYADATTGTRNGVIGDVGGSGYGLYTNDHLYVGGNCTGCAIAFIAQNTGTDVLRVGDVVAVGDVGAVLKGQTVPVLSVRRATASDAFILGVVSGRGEFYAAASDEPLADFDSVQPVEGNVAPGDYLFVVTSGLAQVRVSPEVRSPLVGQSLALNPTGLATLAVTETISGPVFAVAVQAAPDENGLVWAMINVR